MNFPFIYSKFTAAETYGVYMYHADILEPAFSYLNILDNVLVVTNKLLKCGFQIVRSDCPVRILYGRSHELVALYGVSISKVTGGLFILSYNHLNHYILQEK